MEYPYSFIGSYYEVSEILRPIPVDIEQADAGTFPSNIREHLWIEEGENDGRPWKALGRLENGNYFFYTASCDYTGFDCQGMMRLWVSHTFDNILFHAMTEEERSAYLRK